MRHASNYLPPSCQNSVAENRACVQQRIRLKNWEEADYRRSVSGLLLFGEERADLVELVDERVEIVLLSV